MLICIGILVGYAKDGVGFHPLWINLIMQCVSSVTYSFLINGLPTGRVRLSRGIRQGDLLSPYIFIMCSEVLSGLCNRAQEEGTLKEIRVASGSPHINHILFADDTMFFLKANKSSREALKGILKRYEEASGQTINAQKSAITFSKKTPGELKLAVKEDLQIEREGGVCKYLGQPEHFGRKKRDMLASIVDRIKQKASSWSTRYLSPAGKMVMLKGVLSAMPSHSMTCFKLPKSLIKRIQSAVTRFWWDDRAGTKKMAWIAWSKMMQPKSKGGLGFRDFECFNEALLAKLSWRLVHRPDSLLGRILLGKYCTDSGILTCQSKSSESNGWKGILIGRDLLIKNSGWLIGDGNTVEIWSDPWLSTTTRESPMGPATETTASLKVSSLMTLGTTEWDLQKIRDICPAHEDQILKI